MRKGKLIGMGIGPGDPDLMTIRAKRILDSASVIAYPVRRKGEGSTALSIVRAAVDLTGKRILELEFPMDPDHGVREEGRRDAIDEICSVLDGGEDVCMVTLGDVSIFSTYARIDRSVSGRGYETEEVPGITSFCAGAAKAKMPLVLGEEGLAVVGSAKDNESLIRAMDGFENIVVMKASDSIPRLLELMRERGIPAEAGTVISNIGMDGEYMGPMDPEREYGYFTTVMINRQERWKA